MKVQLSQSTAIQIRDAGVNREEIMTLQDTNANALSELRDLKREKEHWDEKFARVNADAARAKQEAALRISQLENDVQMLMQNLKTSNSSLKNFNSNRISVCLVIGHGLLLRPAFH